MLPLGGAVRKAWGKSDYGFPCCWGTLSESFAKLGDSIFFGARRKRPRFAEMCRRSPRLHTDGSARRSDMCNNNMHMHMLHMCMHMHMHMYM